MAYINWAFQYLHQSMDNDPRIIFASAIRLIERKKHIRIHIRAHHEVKPGKAIAFLTHERRYFIFLNVDDLSQRRYVARYRVAHELGHLMCHHLEEMEYLINHKNGDLTGSGGNYHDYRQLIEYEADIFAANMLFAVGEVVERKIITEDEFRSELMPFCDTPLNNDDLRQMIRNDLRRGRYISPPIPLLCHSLCTVFPDGSLLDGKPRSEVARELHQEYRKRLRAPEPQMKPLFAGCADCPDRHEQWCNEEGVPEPGPVGS